MDPVAPLRQLEVVLTAQCNLRCGYCYQDAKQPRSMSWETLLPALDLALASPEREVAVLFIGGEPLLEFPLLARAVRYLEARRARGRRFDYWISTNGLLLDAPVTRFLVRHDVGTQVSFDGVPAAQDLRGRGTHAPLDRLLRRLRGEEPAFFARRVAVAMTLVARTVPWLADSFAYFLRRGVRRISIQPPATHDAGWSDGLRGELDRQFARIYRRSLRHYRATGEVPLELFRRPAEEALPTPRRRGMCGAGSGESLAVDVDGMVTGCVAFAGSYQRFPGRLLRERLEAMRLGGLEEPGFLRRLALYPERMRGTGLFDDKQDKFSSYGRCGECPHLADCSICPVSIGRIPGNDDPRRVPDFACAFNLVALAYRARFPRPPAAERALDESALSPPLRRLRAFATARAREGSWT